MVDRRKCTNYEIHINKIDVYKQYFGHGSNRDTFTMESIIICLAGPAIALREFFDNFKEYLKDPPVYNPDSNAATKAVLNAWNRTAHQKGDHCRLTSGECGMLLFYMFPAALFLVIALLLIFVGFFLFLLAVFVFGMTLVIIVTLNIPCVILGALIIGIPICIAAVILGFLVSAFTIYLGTAGYGIAMSGIYLYGISVAFIFWGFYSTYVLLRRLLYRLYCCCCGCKCQEEFGDIEMDTKE